MSIIVPAGNKNVTWSPKDEEKLTKTASKNSVSKEISNPLYEAAKKFMATASDSCVECKKPMNFCRCNKDEVKEECKEEVKEEVGFETSPVIEVATQEGEKTEEEAKSKVEEAVTKLEEVVADLKDATQKADVAEESEVEIEIVDDKDDKKDEVNEVEIEVEDDKDDIPGKDTSKEEIIVESDEPKMDKSAATEEEFCRFAKLSPENKKKLSNYWVNMLNYPKDYVALMTKDYEK